MSRLFRELLAHNVEKYVDPWARRYVADAFSGDVAAAFSLSVALSNHKRGEVARAMWQAKILRPAFRTYLSSVWLHDHERVIEAAETRGRLTFMFRFAQFPPPADLPHRVAVWRGTSRMNADKAALGYSWTTDRDVACWFAMRLGMADPLVLRGEVHVSSIAFASNERREREVVLMRPPAMIEKDGEPREWQQGADRFEAGTAPNGLTVTLTPNAPSADHFCAQAVAC